MKVKGSKILLVLLLLSLVAVGWSGYKNYVLAGQKTALLDQVSSLERKVRQFRSKYMEQKALSNQYSKIKTNLEGELRAAQEQNAKLEESLAKETTEVYAEVEKLKKASAKAAVRHQKQIEKYRDVIAEWRTQFEALRDESIAKISERDEKIATLTNDNNVLDSKLNNEVQEHNYCRRANSRFAALSQEIVQRYERKSIVDALKEIEPLTQLEKIELEKLVQKFQDDIDKNTL